MPFDTMDPEYGALHLVHILKQHVILEQQIVLALLFGWGSCRQLNWSHCRQNRSNRSSADKKIALLAEQFAVSSVEQIALSGNGWIDGIHFLNDTPLIFRGLRSCTVLMPPFHWATICSRPCRPLPIWGPTLERQQSAIMCRFYILITLESRPIRCKYD